MHKDFMISFHGTDVGLVYNLPKNVRVLMYCLPGKEVSACDANEARTWYVATNARRDLPGAYFKDLKIFWNENKKPLPYCVFSGNLKRHDMNRVPDILLDNEANDFKTGLFQLPARFQKVFLKDRVEQGQHYQPGDIAKIDYRKFHRSIREYTTAKSSLDDHSFLHHFLRPGTLKNRRLGTLGFVVVPQTKYYWSHANLRSTTKKFKRPSVPNTKTKKDTAAVKRIVAKENGLHLSDVVRMLTDAYPGQFITVIATVCRCYHDDLPTRVRLNQEKTSRVTVGEYLDRYAQEDVAAV